jgi:hypothetical protein
MKPTYFRILVVITFVLLCILLSAIALLDATQASGTGCTGDYYTDGGKTACGAPTPHKMPVPKPWSEHRMPLFAP